MSHWTKVKPGISKRQLVVVWSGMESNTEAIGVFKLPCLASSYVKVISCSLDVIRVPEPLQFRYSDVFPFCRGQMRLKTALSLIDLASDRTTSYSNSRVSDYADTQPRCIQPVFFPLFSTLKSQTRRLTRFTSIFIPAILGFILG